MKRGKEGGNGGSDTRRGGGRVGQREGNKGRKAAGRAFKKNVPCAVLGCTCTVCMGQSCSIHATIVGGKRRKK